MFIFKSNDVNKDGVLLSDNEKLILVLMKKSTRIMANKIAEIINKNSRNLKFFRENLLD